MTVCNSKNIFKTVCIFLDNPHKIKDQVQKIQVILKQFKINKSPSVLASLALSKYL